MTKPHIPDTCKLIFIIDDNEVDAFIAKTFIKESGFSGTLKLFTSASDALQLLQKAFIENAFAAESLLIFLDLHMPEFSGLDFLSALQQTKPSVLRQVCILSSEYEEIQHKVVKDFPLAGFISKPFNFEKLQQVLNQISSPALKA